MSSPGMALPAVGGAAAGVGTGAAVTTGTVGASAFGIIAAPFTAFFGIMLYSSPTVSAATEADLEKASKAAAYAARASRRAAAAAAIAAIVAKNMPVLLCRVGGASADKLQLTANDRSGTPMGLSVLAVESPKDAAMAFRAIWPKANSRNHQASFLVGVTTLQQVRLAGFDAEPSETNTFLNHWTITHAAGVAGFSPANLDRLSKAFVDVKVP